MFIELLLSVPSSRTVYRMQGDLEGVIQVVSLIVGKMAEDRGLSKYQARFSS